MCFLATLHKVVSGYPVVVAANRDEFYDRPGTPPGQIAPGVWGGRDPRAGGTWLGVNRGGIVVGVANIRSPRPRRPEARSRGLLCLELLGELDFARLQSRLDEALRAADYNEFNLLAAGPEAAWVATLADGKLNIRPLPPGVHVIGNSPFDPDHHGDADSKVVRGRSLIRAGQDFATVIDNLKQVCGDHGLAADQADAICVHGQLAGTLSSSIIAIGTGRPQHPNVYLHADGKPCATRYRDFSFLLDNR